jgi:hypothetical protein
VPFFVTPEANGYARFMHPGRALLVGLCLAATLGGSGAAARADTTLYRWVDKDGVTHYSDRPAPGAAQVRIASAQTYRGTPVAAARPRGPSAQPALPKAYTRVEVTRPAADEAIANTGGRVDARAAVEPVLAAGHQLWFVLDGTRQTEPSPDLATTLEVERGSHTLEVLITDATGREVVSSTPVSFTYRQTSIAVPPRGPLLQPPKKP